MILRCYMLQTCEQVILGMFQMNAKEDFLSLMEELLNKQPEEALNILRAPKYNGILEKSGWELVSRLYVHLTEKNYLENHQLYDSSVNLLLEIAKFSDPEDVLFEFIEQAEKQNNNFNFIVSIKAMKVILQRLPHRRGVAIGWCCVAILRNISEMCMPQLPYFEDKELLDLENNSQFLLIKEIYFEIIEFFLPFVREIESEKYEIPQKHIDSYKENILKTLLKLFGNPLMNMNLECVKNKGAFRIVAEDILNFVTRFSIDLLSFLEFVDFHCNENSLVESDYSNSSLAVMYYLILVEGIHIEKVPCVYNNIYLLKQLMWLCLSLIIVDDLNAQWKGLSLAEYALSRIGDKQIVFEEINRFQCKNFAEHCAKLMIYSESKRNREKAVCIFHKFLRMFEPRGRYYMLLSIQDVINEPGFVGYLATRTKDFIAEALLSKNREELKYFSGKRLKDLIKKFSYLRDDSETDLMRHSDQIIANLNLIRYLIIRDNDNFTGCYDILPVLNATYFTSLKKALDISRAYYILQKKEMDQPSKLDVRKLSTTLTLRGVELQNLSPEHKVQILNGALNTFDLIDSLLSRVIEIIQERGIF